MGPVRMSSLDLDFLWTLLWGVMVAVMVAVDACLARGEYFRRKALPKRDVGSADGFEWRRRLKP